MIMRPKFIELLCVPAEIPVLKDEGVLGLETKYLFLSKPDEYYWKVKINVSFIVSIRPAHIVDYFPLAEESAEERRLNFYEAIEILRNCYVVETIQGKYFTFESYEEICRKIDKASEEFFPLN